MSAATDLDQAIIHLEEAVMLAPHQGVYGALLGQAYLLRGEPREARTTLEAVWREQPDARSAELLALALLSLEAYEEVLALHAGAGPRRTPLLRALTAWAALARHHFDGAVESFSELLQTRPDDRRSARGLAAALAYRSVTSGDRVPAGRLADLLEQQQPWKLTTREGRLLVAVAREGSVPAGPDVLETCLQRLVRDAVRGFLRDLPGRLRQALGSGSGPQGEACVEGVT